METSRRNLMESRVAASAATKSVAFERQTPSGRTESAFAEPVEPKVDQPDLRLIIEEDQAGAGYVYKTVDRRTGEVVSQIPREEVLKLREDPGYAAGGLIRARV